VKEQFRNSVISEAGFFVLGNTVFASLVSVYSVSLYNAQLTETLLLVFFLKTWEFLKIADCVKRFALPGDPK
jgi:hypothetical protein